MPQKTNTKSHILFGNITDFSLVLIISFGMISFSKILPTPNTEALIILFSTSIGYWLIQFLFFGSTIGQKIWSGIADLKESKKSTLYRIFHFTLSGITTFFCILTCYAMIQKTIIRHPIWLKSSEWKIEPFLPDTREWNILPFFYSIAGWPKSFNNKPIIYSLPYEKGPPHRFIGHIIAELDHSPIQLIIEGPKTPEDLTNLEELKTCFEDSMKLSCLKQRTSALNRHIQEIQSLSPRSWELKWFSVNNPALQQENQPQGIYFHAKGESQLEDRFILIHSNKIHQTIILKRDYSETGNQAFEMIQKIIGSLSLFDNLDSGRAWINKDLIDVTLPDLSNLSDHPELLPRLAEIQNQLISKISVEPASLDAFFHLAGLSLFLFKHPIQRGDGISQVSKSNIKSAAKYTLDIDSKSQKSFETQGILFEMEKNQ